MNLVRQVPRHLSGIDTSNLKWIRLFLRMSLPLGRRLWIVGSIQYSFIQTSSDHAQDRKPMTEKFSSRTCEGSDMPGTNMHFEKRSGALDGCTSTFLTG